MRFMSLSISSLVGTVKGTEVRWSVLRLGGGINVIAGELKGLLSTPPDPDGNSGTSETF